MQTNEDKTNHSNINAIATEANDTRKSKESIVEEEKEEITAGSFSPSPPAPPIPKATFRNVLEGTSQQEIDDMGTRNAGVIDTTKERTKRRNECNTKEADLRRDASLGQRQEEQQQQQNSDGTSRNILLAVPGAVRISGTQIEEPCNSEVAVGILHQESESETFNIDSRDNDQSTLKVEAQAVPETHDIDLIVSERVNQEVLERLEEERKFVVAAEVVEPSQEKTILNLSRNKFFGIAAIVILILVAVGVSIGVTRSNSPSSRSDLVSPTPSPTPLSREAFIASALQSELNYQPWKAHDSPQEKAFDWLTRNDTLDVQNLTSRQVLERYALAILYYNFQPPKSQNDSLSFFLEPVSVCQRHSRDNGVTACINGSYVARLRLGRLNGVSLNLFLLVHLLLRHCCA